MVKIYRCTDLIKVEVGGKEGVTFEVSPLTTLQKGEITAKTVSKEGGTNIADLAMATAMLIKYCVKSVSGVENLDGTKYACQFNPDQLLTDECVSDLMNIEMTSRLSQYCWNFIQGIPDKPQDAAGQPIKGVKIIREKTKGK